VVAAVAAVVAGSGVFAKFQMGHLVLVAPTRPNQTGRQYPRVLPTARYVGMTLR
jgi:hypothetical protein